MIKIHIVFYISINFIYAARPNFVVIARDPSVILWEFCPDSLEVMKSLMKVTDAFDGRIVENKAYKDIVDLENISKSGILEVKIRRISTRTA